MPFLRLKKMREMTSEERGKKLTELRAELQKLRAMVKSGGVVENPARIREIRKAIARVLTIQNEEEARTKIGGV